MAWPKKVPILDLADVQKMPGWHTRMIKVFGVGCEFREAWNLFREECPMGFLKDVNAYNFHWSTTDKEIASVWNRVMRKLGYTVPCER